MMGKTVSLFIFVAIFVVLDLYVWQAFKTTFRNYRYFQAIKIAFWAISSINVVLMIIASLSDLNSWPKLLKNSVVGFWFVMYIPKLVVVVSLFGEDIWRFFKIAINKISGSTEFDPARKAFISKVALGGAAIFSGGLLYGILRGAYQPQVIHQKVHSPKIPQAFEGFKIVQISDIHTGSFISGNFLEECVGIINKLQPDAILFTGDLVNYTTPEVLPFINTLKKLQARHGIYSILGNHDYGDYVRWDNPEEKAENLLQLHHLQKSELGWDLLINENRTLEKDGEQISLVGVENWSVKGNFPKYGDLKKATDGVREDQFTILMSHDPSHWKAEVLGKTTIDLTLSGHTHGMQFGIEIPGWVKLSPVSLVYKEWAGLYSKNDQHLYVNRGLGFLGYPGRLGISPEITVLSLERS